ncbi:MAG: ATP-grasp domain-containing protein [Bacteroidales bacterium]
MKIAILGASKPHLPLYLKAKEMGLEIYCIAWAKNAYCRDYADHYCDISIVDKEAVTELCKREKIDGIVANALEPAVLTLAYVSRQCGFNGISYKAALKAINKKEMRLCVQKTNACPQPNFHIISYSRAEDSISIGDELTKYPVIVKPTDSCASNGITKVNNKEEFAAAYSRAIDVSTSKEILVEEYIDGREVSVESISYHGKHYVLTITDKETSGAPYFVETAHHQPSNLDEDIQHEIKVYVINILNALGIDNTASHAEFKIDKFGNVYFIEIGARGGGDFISYNLVNLSTGYDFIKGIIEVALDIFKVPTCDSIVYNGYVYNKKFSGVYYLSKDTFYIKDFIEKNKDQDWVIDYEIEDKPLKSLRKSQDRTGYIIYFSDHKITLDED